MILQHVWGLMAHPQQEWTAIRDERCTVSKCYCSHVLLLAALPVIAWFIGTTQIGWQLGTHEPVKLTVQSALNMAVLSYVVMLIAVFSLGKAIHWMGQTYGSSQTLPQAIALSAYTATPLWLVGVMLVYPVLWFNLIIGLPALAYTVYLLYTGVPTMMGVSEERGFLFSSAVLAVGLVMLVGVLAATAILWGLGLAPAYTS
jgi:hypothetical protein